jgi:hypothetical protein
VLVDADGPDSARRIIACRDDNRQQFFMVWQLATTAAVHTIGTRENTGRERDNGSVISYEIGIQNKTYNNERLFMLNDMYFLTLSAVYVFGWLFWKRKANAACNICNM